MVFLLGRIANEYPRPGSEVVAAAAAEQKFLLLGRVSSSDLPACDEVEWRGTRREEREREREREREKLAADFTLILRWTLQHPGPWFLFYTLWRTMPSSSDIIVTPSLPLTHALPSFSQRSRTSFLTFVSNADWPVAIGNRTPFSVSANSTNSPNRDEANKKDR